MVFGRSVVLVPYREMHVPKYNQWMKEPALQYLTGSEPLTLQQEYDMMNSWLSDPYKCTFIILDKQLFATTDNQVEAMIGDVNLFFDSNAQLRTAEIEIMIAEESHRGLGKGKEAVLMMIWLAIDLIRVDKFVAKIKYDNISSQNMFVKIGFSEESRSDVFEEITYCMEINDQLSERIKSQVESIEYVLV